MLKISENYVKCRGFLSSFQYLEEMRVQRTGFIHMLLADHYDKPAEVENRNKALLTVLDLHKAESKLTDKVRQGIAKQYAVDLKALLDKVDLGGLL